MKYKHIKFTKQILSIFLIFIMVLSTPVITIASAETITTSYSYDNFSINYRIINEWSSSQIIEVTIINTGNNPISSWSLRYNAGGEISGLWNAEIYKQYDSEYIVKNLDWNNRIEVGESVTFGYMLSGNNLIPPNDFKACCKRVEVVDDFEVQFNIKGQWDTGLEGEIVVTNNSNFPFESWELSFDSNFAIDNMWNAEIIENNGGHYVISCCSWDNLLSENESQVIGLIGLKSNTEFKPELYNYNLTSVIIEDEEEIPDLPDLDATLIDLGYIEKLVSSGMIEVFQDRNGKVKTIIGKFTNKTVDTAEDAAWVLNASSSLFGNNFHADPSNISITKRKNRKYFRFSPVINGVDVRGSQIIIIAENGEVKGINSTYNYLIENVDTLSELSNSDVLEIVYNDLFQTIADEVTFLTNKYELSYEEIKAIIRSMLVASAKLVIGFDNYSGKPMLEWFISITPQNYADDFSEYNDVSNLVSSIDVSYYVVANGNNIGNIVEKYDEDYEDYEDEGDKTSVLSNESISIVIDYESASSDNEDEYDEYEWEPESLVIEDFRGKKREINLQKNNATNNYRFIDDERGVEIYEADNSVEKKSSKLPGKCIELDDKDNPSELDKKAVSALANTAIVYDYYYDVLNRNSYDDMGSEIIVCLNYMKEVGVDNYRASWLRRKSKKEIKHYIGIGNIGEKFAAIDTIGHEFTHGVFYSIIDDADIYSESETAALSESYGDILGNLIEGKPDDDGGRWTIGEDSARNPLRNMKVEEPYLYSEYKNETDEHKKSCVFSYAAFLMMNNPDTSNISNESWAELFYEAMNLSTQDSKFIDARRATLQAAEYLCFSCAERQAIAKAFDDVEIREENKVRIVLEWSDTPRDLDLHLVGPTPDNDYFHVYYADRTLELSDDECLAELDYDVTSSFGPEIIYLYTLTQGDYYVYVHDYTNRDNKGSNELSISGATIILYCGTSNKPIKLPNGNDAKFNITSKEKANLWSVCKISVGKNDDIYIEEIGELIYHNDSSTIGNNMF